MQPAQRGGDAERELGSRSEAGVLRDRHIWIEEGEFLVVPRGVEHRPVAEEEAWIVLFEPASTLNTGNVVNERTVAQLERV